MTKKICFIILMFSMFILTSCKNNNASEQFEKVSAGFNHSIALSTSGDVYTWGKNTYGQLGNGTTIDKTTPDKITQFFHLQSDEVITDIISGDEFSIAITSNNRIFTWGYNWHGQLGDGTKDNSNLPLDITDNFDFQSDESIDKIVATYHSILLTSKGRVFAWGNNMHGELGDGTNESKTTPVEITQNFNLQSGEVIEAIAHNMAATSNHRVFSWGLNDKGQLGDGTTTNTNTPNDITSNITQQIDGSIVKIKGEFLISSDNHIYIWRYRTSQNDETSTNQSFLQDITSDFNLQTDDFIIEIVHGKSYIIALSSLGYIFTVEMNQIELEEDGTISMSPTEITEQFNLAEDEKIVKVDSKSHHIAITSSGRIFTWGENQFGQLGDGTTTNKDTPIEIEVK